MFKLLFPIVAVLCIAQLHEVSDYFFWERSLILQGEVWRIISANFTHTNIPHLVMNAAGLGIFCFIFKEELSIKKLWGLLLSLSTFVGGILLLTPMNSYVGLSGVLHGLFMWAAIKDIRNQNYMLGGLLCLGLLLKVFWEQYFGASTQTASLIKATVAIDAHLIGALSGAALQLFSWAIASNKASDDLE